MEISTYPLICWRLPKGQVLALQPENALEVLAADLKKARQIASETLQARAERGDWVASPEFGQPRLKVVDVRLRLTYRSNKGTFPLTTPETFQVLALYGSPPALEGGGGEVVEGGKCYLPFLEESFHYFSEVQLSALIEHFARSRLEDLPPGEAYRFHMPGPPWLESISVKLSETPSARKDPWGESPDYQALQNVAEALPRTRSERARLHLFPEVAWEQTALVKDLVGRLGRQNLLVVGEPGVGKSVALNEAIRRAHLDSRSQDSPPTFWRTTGQHLIGGARYLGEWQQMLDEVVEHVEEVHGVLWVVDLIDLIYSEGEGPEDSLAAYLQPALEHGRIRLVGECTPMELEAARRALPGFIDQFHLIPLTEMDTVRTRKVLDLFAQHTAATIQVELPTAARDCGYRLLQRYLPYQSFPGKAVRFFGDCVREARERGATFCDADAILGTFSRQTGLPERFLRDEQPLDEAEVRAFFAGRIVGQSAAVTELVRLVFLFKAGLNDPAKPIAALLFAGPTGVGKTAAAKALAAYFFGADAADVRHGRDPLFRVDMSEYQYAFQLGRLLGEGKRPGSLVEHVRSRPFSVILLDEIEKADPVIFDVLLGLLDEGRLRDTRGRLTDFRSSIIVMTTNLGVRTGGTLGFNTPDDNPEHTIRAHFRPEFFNRIDRVLAFQPLDRDTITRITEKELQALTFREGLVRRNLTLNFTPGLVQTLAEKGYSPRYGARPLQRAIERYVVGALAQFLLDPQPHGRTLTLDWVGDGVVVG